MSDIVNGKEYIRKLINITYLSIGIPLLFFIWVYLESNAETLNAIVDQEYNVPVFVFVFLISLVSIVLGNKKYKTFLREARQKDTLQHKLIIYQKGITVRFIAFSISSFLIAFGFFLTDFQPFAAFFGIMIVLFSINSPNARKLAIDLQLKDDDKNVILKGLDLPK